MHGMTFAQVYVTMEGFVKVYDLKNKAEAIGSLNNFCMTVGLFLTIVTNTSKTVCGKWDMVKKVPFTTSYNRAGFTLAE